jgi:multicomponent Na+:H+ antiporter subunit A
MNFSVLTLIIMALPFAIAVIAPRLLRELPRLGSPLLAAFPALMFAHFLRFLPEIAGGGQLTGGITWVPSLNVSFSFALDGLSLTFALLITGIGALVILYAGAYLSGHRHLGRLQAFLFLFLGAMLGLVLSDSFLMLFFFWELTSVASFLLIGFDHDSAKARRAAVQALVITGGGGLFLLAGLLVLWSVTGVSTFSLATMMGSDMRQSPSYMLVLSLVLVAAFTKSAQFPFHVWLPNAMQAPTPVSAFLHSATMVKAGVYLLMRFTPLLGGTPLWETVLPIVGGLTLVFASLTGLRQTDLKQVLAYSTVASLGLLVMLTGFGSAQAVPAAILYLIAHALFKCALFMVAGSIDHGSGTRDIGQLSGLARTMPFSFAIAVLAALSMAGLPPLLGFLAKEELYAALTGGNLRAWFFTFVALVGNVAMVGLAYLAGIKPFIGRQGKIARHAHESPFGLLLGPAILSLIGFGLAPMASLLHLLITNPAASAIAGRAANATVTLVPHWGMPLILSLLTISAGLLLCLFIHPVRRFLVHIETELDWSFDRAFDRGLILLQRAAFQLTRASQNGRLGSYVMTLVYALVLALFIPLAARHEWPQMPDFAIRPTLAEALVFALAILGVAAVLFSRSRLVAIISLGLQGFAVALIFLLFAAPDLAFTQVMVETLSVVILALILTRLDLAPTGHRPPIMRLFDGTLALLAASGLTLVLLKVTQLPLDQTLSNFFATHSKTLAHGANVVNVIIVDFRGTDTLGEIAVVFAAGIAVLALVRLRAATPSRLARNDPAMEDAA